MASCKDIYVNIHDYDPTSTYVVNLKFKDSVIGGDLIPGYSITATSSQVVFKGVGDYAYIVCIKRTCPNTGISAEICKDVTAPLCKAPTDVVISGITDTTATVTFTVSGTNTYEYALNDLIFKPAVSPISLTGLIPGSANVVIIRAICGANKKSLVISTEFTTTTPAVTFVKQEIEKVCKGSVFQYHVIQFTLSGGIAAVGKVYRIKQTDPANGSVNVIAKHTVISGDTYQSVINGLTKGSSPFNVAITNTYGTFSLKVSNPYQALYCNQATLTSVTTVDII